MTDQNKIRSWNFIVCMLYEIFLQKLLMVIFKSL